MEMFNRELETIPSADYYSAQKFFSLLLIRISFKPLDYIRQQRGASDREDGISYVLGVGTLRRRFPQVLD
jgi:hypothetical protein